MSCDEGWHFSLSNGNPESCSIHCRSSNHVSHTRLSKVSDNFDFQFVAGNICFLNWSISVRFSELERTKALKKPLHRLNCDSRGAQPDMKSPN
jgi:hypothetical protein